MIRIQKAFDREKLQSAPILQVHDELNFDVLKSELEQVKEIVKNMIILLLFFIITSYTFFNI